jgi:hypothetical protein
MSSTSSGYMELGINLSELGEDHSSQASPHGGENRDDKARDPINIFLKESLT